MSDQKRRGLHLNAFLLKAGHPEAAWRLPRTKDLFPQGYEGTTLREYYGLPVPASQFHPGETRVSGG